MKQLYLFALFLFTTIALSAQSYKAGDTIATYDNGYMVIKCPSGHLTLCDDAGNQVLPCNYIAIGQANDYLYWGQVANDYWGNGSLFPNEETYDEELSYVPWEEFDKGTWVLYDRTGKPVIQDTFQYPFRLEAGLGIAKLLNGKEGVLTSELTWLIPPKYDFIVKEHNNNAGFIVGYRANMDSTRYIHPLFSLPTTTENPAHLYGFVDAQGKLIVPVQYDAIGMPFCGFIPVAKGYNLGMCSMDGRLVLPPSEDTFFRTKALYPTELAAICSTEWHDADTSIFNSITNKALRALALNHLLRYKLQTKLYNELDGLQIWETANNYINMAFFVLPFELYPLQGTWCNLAYYQQSALVAASPISISFQVVYQNCEECTRVPLPNCEYVELYENYLITPSGIVKSSFNDQFNVPETVLKKLLMNELATKLPDFMPCVDSSYFYDNATQVAVFNQQGVDFYLSIVEGLYANDCSNAYYGSDLFVDDRYPYIILTLPYKTLKPYAVKGSGFYK